MPRRDPAALRFGCQCGRLDAEHEIDGDFVMSGTFDMSVTCRVIRNAARDRSVISYDELEEVHKIQKRPGYNRSALFWHLGDVLCVSYQLGLPAITVVVVKKGFERLDGNTLVGFVNSASEAGYKVGDKDEFEHDQKEATFRWARDADAKLGGTKELGVQLID